jgi:hypothetical protein
MPGMPDETLERLRDRSEVGSADFLEGRFGPEDALRFREALGMTHFPVGDFGKSDT